MNRGYPPLTGHDFTLMALTIFLITISIILKYRRESSSSERILLAILLLGFLFRMIIGVLINIPDMMPVLYIADHQTYQEYASNIIKGVWPLDRSAPIINYAWLLSRFYVLLGEVPFTATVLSGLIGTIVIWNIYRTVELLADRSAAALVAGISAIMPSVVFVTSQTVRDPIIFLLLSTIVYWMVRIEIGVARRPFILGAGSLIFTFFLSYFRPHQRTLILCAFVIVGVFTFFWSRTRPRVSAYCLRSMGLIAICLLVWNPGFLGAAYLRLIDPTSNFFQSLHHQRLLFVYPKDAKAFNNMKLKRRLELELKKRLELEGITGGLGIETIPPSGTTIVLSLKSDSSLSQFILRLPIRALSYLFSPFPWQIETSFIKVAVLENLVFYVLFFAGLCWLPFFSRTHLPKSYFILIYLLLTITIYGVVHSNVGTGYRHRMQFIWLLYIPGAAFLSFYLRKVIQR